MASSIGSTIEGSSFSGLLTPVEIGHIRIKSEGNGRIKSRRIRLLAEPAGIISRRENDRHSVMDIGYQLISIGGDGSNVRIHSPELGCFQFSQTPAIPNAVLSFMAMA